MQLKVLVINTGSSSIKYQLLDMPDGRLLCSGLLERIGLDATRLNHFREGKEFTLEAPGVKDHLDGIKLVLEKILDAEYGMLKDVSEIGAVGHRTVHGGEAFTGSVLVDDDVVSMIRKCIPLAPLHNPANLAGIEAAMSSLPGVPQVAVFDTAFHQTIPEQAYMYALPYEFYEVHRLRRYGFHGTSHRYVSSKACEVLGLDIEGVKIITCHLGSGASVAAIDGGKSVDTSMGLTPLEGLIMGTRCGDIDPSIHKFLIETEGLDIAEIDNILNKQSGLLGISGISSDIRDIRKAAEGSNQQARLALQMFCYRVKKYIGAYAAAMGGVDVLVFTGGIGENNPGIRGDICKGMGFLGIEIDTGKNDCSGETRVISPKGRRVHVLVVVTNEELVIASDTYEIVKSEVKAL